MLKLKLAIGPSFWFIYTDTVIHFFKGDSDTSTTIEGNVLITLRITLYSFLPVASMPALLKFLDLTWYDAQVSILERSVKQENQLPDADQPGSGLLDSDWKSFLGKSDKGRTTSEGRGRNNAGWSAKRSRSGERKEIQCRPYY